MQADYLLLFKITATFAALALFATLLFRLVAITKKRGSGLPALGAILMLFGFGSVRDPAEDSSEQSSPLRREDADSDDEDQGNGIPATLCGTS